MLRDPVEQTDRFKAVSAEVENKVMMTYIEPMIKALEDIINNGFTYSKESMAFREVNQVILRIYMESRKLPVVPEKEAKEKEEMAKERLATIRSLLEEGKVKEVFERYGLYQFGCCHGYWRRKKSILKDEYGIDWKTPEEMNPTVIFE